MYIVAMGIDRVVIQPILFALFLFARISKQEKEVECVKGSQYWSKSFLSEKETCVQCPLHWKNCYDQPINDQRRCVDSCRVGKVFDILLNVLSKLVILHE